MQESKLDSRPEPENYCVVKTKNGKRKLIAFYLTARIAKCWAKTVPSSKVSRMTKADMEREHPYMMKTYRARCYTDNAKGKTILKKKAGKVG